MTSTTKRDGSRTYSVPDADGNLIDLPSVTTILRIVNKPALIYWAANSVANYALDHLDEVNSLMGNQVGMLEDSPGPAPDRDGAYRLLKGSPWSHRDRAANVGTIVHDTIAKLTLDEFVDVPVAAKPYVDAWGEFIKDYGREFEAAEMTVFSLTHGYAGTLDALFRFGKLLGTLDYKTRQGKKKAAVSAYETELLQVAAYSKAEWILLPDGSSERMPKIDGGSILMLCDDGYAVSKIDMESDFEGFLAARALFAWNEAL